MTTLNWHGQAVLDEVADRMELVLKDVDREIEEQAKQQLYPGHGYDTGTLQRSIHSAGPGYNWPGDNVERSLTTPERGGKPFQVKRIGDRIESAVGSGQDYAIYVHQGHELPDGGWWTGYYYIVHGMKKMLGKIPGIVKKRMA